MELENLYKILIGGYFGIQAMDDYELKVYILKDIEEYIRSFIKLNKINNFDYKEVADDIKSNLSLKRKLQDALLVLPKVDAPIELMLLVKHKIKDIEKEERVNTI